MYGFQGNARIFAQSRKTSALGWSRYMKRMKGKTFWAMQGPPRKFRDPVAKINVFSRRFVSGVASQQEAGMMNHMSLPAVRTECTQTKAGRGKRGLRVAQQKSACGSFETFGSSCVQLSGRSFANVWRKIRESCAKVDGPPRRLRTWEAKGSPRLLLHAL